MLCDIAEIILFVGYLQLFSSALNFITLSVCVCQSFLDCLIILFDFSSASLNFNFIKQLQDMLPSNFFPYLRTHYVSIDGLGRVIMIFCLFFSFNFSSYIFIKGALMELEQERLEITTKEYAWTDMFFSKTEFNGLDLYCDPRSAFYNENLEVLLRSSSDIFSTKFSFFWVPNVQASKVHSFYAGTAGQEFFDLARSLEEAIAVFQNIQSLRMDLATPLFELLKQKPNTSFFANFIYLVWLLFDIDAKIRFLRYKNNELGEIVLEILLKQTIYQNAEQLHMKFRSTFHSSHHIGKRQSIVKNLQIISSNIGFLTRIHNRLK